MFKILLALFSIMLFVGCLTIKNNFSTETTSISKTPVNCVRYYRLPNDVSVEKAWNRIIQELEARDYILETRINNASKHYLTTRLKELSDRPENPYLCKITTELIFVDNQWKIKSQINTTHNKIAGTDLDLHNDLDSFYKNEFNADSCLKI